MTADIDAPGFDEVLNNSILCEDFRFARTSPGKTLVYSVQESKFTAIVFIIRYVPFVKYIEVDTLMNNLGSAYGLNLNRNSLFFCIKGSTLYYDRILDDIYKDYETYC